MNESTGYTENREDEDPAVSAFDKQHDNDMLPNVPEDEDSQTETVPDATNLPAHPIRSPSPTFLRKILQTIHYTMTYSGNNGSQRNKSFQILL